MLHLVCFSLVYALKYYLWCTVHGQLAHVLPGEVSRFVADSLFSAVSIYSNSVVLWSAHYYDMFVFSGDVCTSCVLVTLALTWETKLAPVGVVLAVLQSLVDLPRKTSELVRKLNIPAVGIMCMNATELLAVAYYGVYAMYGLCSFMILDTAVSNEKLSYFVYFFSSVCLLKNVHYLYTRIGAMVL